MEFTEIFNICCFHVPPTPSPALPPMVLLCRPYSPPPPPHRPCLKRQEWLSHLFPPSLKPAPNKDCCMWLFMFFSLSQGNFKLITSFASQAKGRWEGALKQIVLCSPFETHQYGASDGHSGVHEMLGNPTLGIGYIICRAWYKIRMQGPVFRN